MKKINMENPGLGTIVRLAWPPMLDYFLLTALTIVDLIFVGRLGSDSVAALGVGWPIILVANSLFMSLGIGTAAVVAHHIGAGNQLAARQALGASALFFSLLGFVIGGLMAWLASPIYGLFGVSRQVQELGRAYFLFLMPLLGFRSLYFIAAYSLRGGGDMKTPLAMSGAALVVGGIADAVLVPRIGMAGAGLSYGLVSLTLGLFSGVYIIARLGVRARDVLVGGRHLGKVVKISLPALLEQAVLRVGFLGFVRLVTGLGTVAIAAHILAVRMESLSFMPGVGLGTAAGTLAGQGLGAGLPGAASRSVHRLVRMSLGVMAVFGLLLLMFASPFFRIFSPEPGVRELAILCITIAAVEQPAFGMYFPYLWALRISGWTQGALILASVGSFITRIPLGYFFGYTLGLGLAGVWMGGVLDWYIRGFLAMLLFRWGRWKKAWAPTPVPGAPPA